MTGLTATASHSPGSETQGNLTPSRHTRHLNEPRTSTRPNAGLYLTRVRSRYLRSWRDYGFAERALTDPPGTSFRQGLSRSTARVSVPRRLAGPVQFLKRLMEDWALTEADAALLLGFNETDLELVGPFLEGREALSGRDVRDRIAHLFEIRKTLSMLFRDLDTENGWLREPQELLDQRDPMSLLLGGSMEDLLLVRDYVDAAAGR